MADFYTQFSCIFDVGSAENAARAEMIRGEFAAELDRDEGENLGFGMEVDHESGPGALWIHSDEYGGPEHVIRFVLRCAADLKLAGLWGFTWSHSCSKPRIDAFGGGAHVLDLSAGATVADIDCGNVSIRRIPWVMPEFVGQPISTITASGLIRRPGIAKLTDAETCEGSWEATARCHADQWTQVSCRQIRKAFALAGWSLGRLLELKGDPPCSKPDQSPLNLSLPPSNAPTLHLGLPRSGFRAWALT